MKKKRYSLLAVSEMVGHSREFCRKKLKECGVPVGADCTYTERDIIQAFESEATKSEQSLKDRKLAEEIRKLKLRNDRDDGKLVPIAEVAEFINQCVSEWRGIAHQKFVNEAAAALEMLDAPNIRFRMKKYLDACDFAIGKLADKYPIQKQESTAQPTDQTA